MTRSLSDLGDRSERQAPGLRCVGWILVVALAGCAAGTPIPEDRFFELTASSPAQRLPTPALDGGMTVEPVMADPMRGGRAIVYRPDAKPLELRRYHYEYWVDEPPDMVQRALVSYLSRSGLADVVKEASLRADTDYSLRMRLLRFEHLVGDSPSVFEVEMAVTLYSRRSDTVLLSRVYRRRQKAGDGDMHSVALAMQTAIDSIFHSLATDIDAVKTRL